MTRLLMTCDAVGGVWQYATGLSRALRAHGVETVLAVLGPSPAASVNAEFEVIDTGLPLDWLAGNAGCVLTAGEAISSLSQKAGADLVQLNSPALGCARFDVPVIAVAHGCVATWWSATREEALDPEFDWHAELSRRGLEAADIVVAPTAAYAATLAATYRLASVPLAVHNGISIRGSIGNSLEKSVFTVGRLWDAAKGTGVLDRIAGRLAVPFRAAGPLVAPHGETVKVDHLQTLGTLDADGIAAELAGRPIYVSSAVFEPFGLAVLEAAQAGCPLVLSDIPTFRELWGEVAIFVDPADDQTFTSEINQLLDQPQRADELGRAAASRAARYVPERTAAAMAGLYARLLGMAEARAA